MSGLFGSKKAPEPEPPAPMPDPYDAEAKKAKREEERRVKAASSTTQNKLAPVPGTIGREYSRSTLGAA